MKRTPRTTNNQEPGEYQPGRQDANEQRQKKKGGGIHTGGATDGAWVVGCLLDVWKKKKKKMTRNNLTGFVGEELINQAKE